MIITPIQILGSACGITAAFKSKGFLKIPIGLLLNTTERVITTTVATREPIETVLDKSVTRAKTTKPIMIALGQQTA